MKRRVLLSASASLLALTGLFLVVGQASAHVVYGSSLFSDASVIDPSTGVAGVGSTFSNQDRTVSSNAGWVAGLNATTGANSHDNRFLYFNLAQAQTIDFTITGTNTNGNGVLNPGFSIFSGLAPNLSHDGSYYAGQSTFASWSSFASNNANIIANGGALTDRWGAYHTNANFTMANDSAQVSTLVYSGLSRNNSTGNVITGHYQLGPGVYSLIVGGANATDLAAYLSDAIASNSAGTAYANDRLARSFNIAFNVTPVPLPAAVWLFGSGLAGVIAFARRRMSV